MDVEVWLVFPSSAKSRLASFRRKLRRVAQREGWTFQERLAFPERGAEGRGFHLLDGRDAVAVYKRAHRVRLLIFSAGRIFVRVDPRRRPDDKTCLTLETYLCHKAHANRVDRARLDVRLPNQLIQFRGWCEEAGCEGLDDPRCLPLHVFEGSPDPVTLQERAGRDQFDVQFGTNPRTSHNGRLVWERGRPESWHGREVLHSGGYELPQGFHWDVNREERPRGSVEVPNVDKVWKVRRTGYVNIYPDAHIRRGRDAEVVWPR